MRHGTEAQKRRFIPKILSAEEIWCQLFSEPGAGSDLAAIRTRAEREGDGYRLTGQKVWTSFARLSRWAICLARTDPSAAKHRGITYFIVDMEAPGVTVRPLRQLTGSAEFNEVFLDAVAVPRDHVIGPENGGWGVAMDTLAHERGTSYLFKEQVKAKIGVERLLALVRQRAAEGRPVHRALRAEAVRAWIAVEPQEGVLDAPHPAPPRDDDRRPGADRPAHARGPARGRSRTLAAELPLQPFVEHFRGDVGDPAEHRGDPDARVAAGRVMAPDRAAELCCARWQPNPLATRVESRRKRQEGRGHVPC